MRCMKRNQVTFHYATFVGKHPLISSDEYGNELRTGESEIEYSEPTRCKANITPASGIVATQLFGTSEGYDKILVMDDPHTSIDEFSVLWIDARPDAEQNVPYDYIVKRVARSLNSVAIAVSKVDVRNE